MKKGIAFLLICIMCLALCACGGESKPEATPEPTKSPETLAREAELKEQITGVLPFAGKVTVSIEEDVPHVRVEPATSDITFFGNRVYDTIAACDQIFGNERYSLYFMDTNLQSKSVISFSHDTAKDYYGFYTDNRSGKLKNETVKTLDDLMDLFPALRIHVSELEVSEEFPEAMEIYQHVMERLDAEPDRAEEEILEEIAAEYEMTYDDLRQLVFDMMEKVY